MYVVIDLGRQKDVYTLRRGWVDVLLGSDCIPKPIDWIGFPEILALNIHASKARPAGPKEWVA